MLIFFLFSPSIYSSISLPTYCWLLTHFQHLRTLVNLVWYCLSALEKLCDFKQQNTWRKKGKLIWFHSNFIRTVFEWLTQYTQYYMAQNQRFIYEYQMANTIMNMVLLNINTWSKATYKQADRLYFTHLSCAASNTAIPGQFLT